MTTIAFIGLGNMGSPMAANLVKAGYRVRGFDLSPAALDVAMSTGVELARSASEAVSAADIVISMLPAGQHVLVLYRELLSLARPETLFIDCSTIDVAAAREVHALAATEGHDSVDAPVSGGVGGANAGTLTFMVGAEKPAFDRAKPVLEHMGTKVVHCGGGGAGQAAKVCNNMILGISMIAVSEAFVLGEKLGLTHQALFDVAQSSSGQCWSLTSYCPVPGPVPSSPANNHYKSGFAAALMLKDLALARDAATSTGANVALGRLAHEIYMRFVKDGQGGNDFSGIIKAIRNERGLDD